MTGLPRIAFALLLTFSLGMQASAPGSHRVTGVVHDPNAGVRLAGAVVQAVRVADSSAAPQTFTAVADSLGRFVLEGLPDGRYAIGFQHRALEVLNVESPIDAFELGADSTVRINLAVPSGSVLREMLCGPSREKARDGVLAGLLVSGEVPVSGATVTARWTEVGIIRGKIGPAPHEATATTGPEGTYHLCDLPSDAAVNVDVRGAARRRIEGEVFIPTASVVRRDFHLADSSAVRGTGVLAGRVSGEDGTAIGTARVSIPALGIAAPVRDGAFTLAQVPEGTWALEVRAIGYEPLSALVEVAAQVSVPAKITMAKEAQKLEAVNVVGKASREVKVLSGITERMRAGAGTSFMPGNSWLKAAFDPSDVMRGARGFSLKSPTLAIGRDYMDGRGIQQQCRTQTLTDTVRGGGKEVAVYIDGLRAPGGLEQMNNELRMDQVLAMETYPDVITAPFIWRNSTTCAVIAVWTKP